MSAIQNSLGSLELSFDVGHSSIGWAIIKGGENPIDIDILGTGVVTFPANDCLASERRNFRRQRRHIRSTRQRINRIGKLLTYLEILTSEQITHSLQTGAGHHAPWLLAAQAINGIKILTSIELWDVLRWYAHNRGYDGNSRWAKNQTSDDETEKVEAARTMMKKLGHNTMAETICAFLGVTDLKTAKGVSKNRDNYFKGQNLAFPREIVVSEVKIILSSLIGKINKINENFIRCFIGDQDNDWQAVICPSIKLPQRYQGGLLFGQLVPRFDNRIISICPISGDKVPTVNCPEFYRYRWAMLLSNIKSGQINSLSFLNADDRKKMTDKMKLAGKMTKPQFIKAVREVTQIPVDNLEQMFLHPDADKALVLDPAVDEIIKKLGEDFWQKVPIAIQKRYLGKLRRYKEINVKEIIEDVAQYGITKETLEDLLPKQKKMTKGKEQKNITETISIDKIRGRAPFSRKIMQQAYNEMLEGKDPRSENGCLYLTQEMRHKQLNRSIEEQTNNHLVRHRLLILQRLTKDIITEFSNSDSSRFSRVTIEVNRDLREMSGKTKEDIDKELRSRLSNFQSVEKYLKENLDPKHHSKINASLLRKARIAHDLDWTCPYTLHKFDPIDLINRKVDKDHIIPRSDRQSDSLDSLVITFSSVNKMKGKRTALQFIEDEGGKSVPDGPNLSICSRAEYLKFVEKLDTRKGHDDDKRRKKNRKKLMEVKNFNEKGFLPKDLTQTSQLVRLGAQSLKKHFQNDKTVIVSLPGSVTGETRKAWDLIGCLSQACPQILNQDKSPKTKTEIRNITHLHHALDACVLGLASRLLPNNGHVWNLILKRNLTPSEAMILRGLGIYEIGSDGKSRLKDLPAQIKNQISEKLAERRVVQHIPADMTGLRADLNIWGVKYIENGRAYMTQNMRQADGSIKHNQNDEKIEKLIGPNKPDGKIGQLRGAIKINANYGIALDPEPTIIPWHKVWHHIQELKMKNGGKMPRILRNGMTIKIPNGSRKGIWRIISVKDTQAYGKALDLSELSGMYLAKGNAPIETLIKDGLSIMKYSFTGKLP